MHETRRLGGTWAGGRRGGKTYYYSYSATGASRAVAVSKQARQVWFRGSRAISMPYPPAAETLSSVILGVSRRGPK